MRTLFKFGLALIVIYVALLGGLFAAMLQPPPVFGRIMSKLPAFAYYLLPFEPMWLLARKGRLNVGEPAPDFNLPTANHSQTVRLSSFRGKEPVVLIFGSHT